MRYRAKALLVIAALLCMTAYAGMAMAQGKSRVVCYTAYDADYFYFAAVVQKPQIAGSQTEFFSDPVRDDAISVFLQTGDGNPGAKRTAKSVQMAVSAAGGAQIYRGAAGKPLSGFADFLPNAEGRPVPFKLGVSRKGNLNGSAAADNGYTVEMAIPWVELGGPPTVGQHLRFNVVSYNAAPGSSPILSMAPGVKTAADVQNPSLWGEVVFVDAPVKTVATAPQAKVAVRVFTAKPLIDGAIEPGVWTTLTSFTFGETTTGTVEAAPAVANARAKPTVTLRKARPAIKPKQGASPSFSAHSPQPVPNLVFALYNYDFQNDHRKAATYLPARAQNGASLLASHPLDGSGPWMSYDRVDWHRRQLEDVRQAGIDVILPVYRADVHAKQRYSQRGLMTLAAALKYLAASGRDYPLVALHLDTNSLSNDSGGKPDLTDTKVKAQLYAAIRDFFIHIPRRFRAALPLDAKEGPGVANVVVLSSGAAFSDMDGSFVDYCRGRFVREFGADLLVLGSSDFKAKAKLDGYVNDTRGRGFQMDRDGWIKPASLGVGLSDTKPGPSGTALTVREDSATYRNVWKQAVAAKPDWVFIDGWNDFGIGAEIAPSLQNGLEYVDITRAYTRAFSGFVPSRAVFLTHDLPTVAAAGTSLSASVRLLNAGSASWTPDAYALAYRWVPAGGAIGPSTAAPLAAPVQSGSASNVAISLKAPTAPGSYTLQIDMAQTGKKGEVTTVFSAQGSRMLSVPVRVVAAGNAGGGYGITVLNSDLPAAVETGGTYVTTVTVRNDGATTWKKGDAGRVVGRVWRYVSPINSTGEGELAEPVDMADASAELPADVPPGGTATLTVPVTFGEADGAGLTPWAQSDNWVYQMRWEYSADESGSAGAVSTPETIAITEMDLGAQFINDGTPPQLPGDRRVPVRLGLRNRGPQTWLKQSTRIGYHWYYLDGTEVVWQDETTPLLQDIEPGGEVTEMLAWITPPPYDGTYWLVWDLRVGDAWGSTQASSRPFETLVRQVEVVRGKLALVDLDKSYNLDGIAGTLNRADGNFDGAGRSLPAELVPPFVNAESAPSTLWLPSNGTGVDSSRRISFRWGSKGEKENNLIQCVGQRVPLGEPRKLDVAKQVHLLAASTKDNAIGQFTLVFADGTQQLSTFALSRWDRQPLHGEEVAYRCKYSRKASGDDPDTSVSLYHYVIKVAENKKLAAILMPNAPDVKVAAITLEK
jgi:hypothetical protein